MSRERKTPVQMSWNPWKTIMRKSTIFWDVTPSSLVEVSDVFEERTASIFRGKEQAEQASSKWNNETPQTIILFILLQ
jgi:hypothetical protein